MRSSGTVAVDNTSSPSPPRATAVVQNQQAVQYIFCSCPCSSFTLRGGSLEAQEKLLRRSSWKVGRDGHETPTDLSLRLKSHFSSYFSSLTCNSVPTEHSTIRSTQYRRPAWKKLKLPGNFGRGAWVSHVRPKTIAVIYVGFSVVFAAEPPTLSCVPFS